MVEPQERRKKLLSLLQQSSAPRTGAELAAYFKVSRQVIVQDIAILRAAGEEIFSTPPGYLLITAPKTNWVQEIIACKHTREQIEDELGLIIDLGGRVLDVIVEHPVYGQLQGSLMIAGRRDLNIFLEKINETGANPLSFLTGGSHLHTVEAPSRQVIDEILKQLQKKGFLDN